MHPYTGDYTEQMKVRVFKAFATLQKYNLIMQGSNTTRNRVWKYSYLDFIFTLPSINQTICD